MATTMEVGDGSGPVGPLLDLLAAGREVLLATDGRVVGRLESVSEPIAVDGEVLDEHGLSEHDRQLVVLHRAMTPAQRLQSCVNVMRLRGLANR